MAKTAAFHGRISAGIDCKLKMGIYVFTELGLRGSPEGRRRQCPFGCCRHRDAKRRIKLQTLAVDYMTVNTITSPYNNYLLENNSKADKFHKY